jgi:hypothetical protein
VGPDTIGPRFLQFGTAVESGVSVPVIRNGNMS